MPIPLKTALIGSDSGSEIAPERVILLDQPEQTFVFEDIGEKPLLSINRDFSAPIILDAERGEGELEKLAQSDTDPFARYEAMQELMLRNLIASSRGEEPDPEPLVSAVASTLRSNSLDPALKAEAVLLPSEAIIADRMETVDPDSIHEAREALRAHIGKALQADLVATRGGRGPAGDDLSPSAKGLRKLRLVSLGLIAAADPADGAKMAKAQFDAAGNMTERQGALAVLVFALRSRKTAGAGRLFRPVQKRSAGTRQMVRASGCGAAQRHDR